MCNICAGGISDDREGEYRSTTIGAKWIMIKSQRFREKTEKCVVELRAKMLEADSGLE
jgi:hypothetical protein